MHETLRHFNIDRKRIREWNGKYESLLQQNFGKSNLRRKLSNGAPVFSEELDDALASEVLDALLVRGCSQKRLCV
ncbi:hypothetical protein HPB50_016327 [Hyalomma asiaticum]|uniref:Uncharacterized protein n=1 Tax=Hyalomma asiaticum TaxID=266040 RepID=A0ACB7RR89_HYAAI|nr:hypothetical protein HPB50_016327 [Hyalomma asiaticum]